VIQRIKGWGKDPLAAVIAAVEFVGPCRFTRWAEDHPVAVENPAAWVQVAATSKDQTRNTMTLFPALFQPHCTDQHSIDMGKEIIYAHQGARRIEAVTSSPRSLEGGRPTFTIANETQHWLKSNEGHEMWQVVQRNAMKAPDGSSRVMALTNAYDPSEDSIAQRRREGWEKTQAGKHIDVGIMYDTVEAPPEAPLTAEDAAAVIKAVRGDSWWVDPESYANYILDPDTSPSLARRFGYNQVTAAEDAWLDPNWIQATIADLPTTPADEWVAFFDGSKSDDATALVACRLADGHVATVFIEERPKAAPDGWQVDRFKVDGLVRQWIDDHNVVAFFADPSHALDDEGFGYWDAVCDGWHRDFGDDMELWPVQSGPNRHSIIWDMASPSNHKVFVQHAVAFVEDMEHTADGTVTSPERGMITHDGHPLLHQHLRNARRYPTKFGVSLMKENRSSARKIDAAVCAVGARMVRRMVLNKGRGQKRTGRVV
jgi:phage terminase large subunit-like protein